MSRLQANLVLLLTGAIWGGGFVVQANAMADIGPLLFTGLRFLAATVAMLPFAVWEGRREGATRLRPADWRAFAVIGALLLTGSIAQQYGLLTTSVTNSGFLTGLYVVMVPLFGVALFRQWPHPVVWPCAFLALFGIFLLSGGALGTLTVGDWLTIVCAVFWAFQLIMIARHAAGTGRPITLAVTQFAVCGVVGTTLGLVLEPIDLDGLTRALPLIFYAGVISGGIAFTLQAIAQRHTTAAQAAIFLSSEAVFAGLAGAVFLGERLPPAGLAGCALILAAIVCVEAIPAALARRRAATP